MTDWDDGAGPTSPIRTALAIVFGLVIGALILLGASTVWGWLA